MLFGWLPAWRASRADPLTAIHGAAFARPGRHSLLSRAVIAAQIALSLVLLFSAGLFTRTLRNLRAADLGFRPENLVDVDIDLARTTYEKQAGALFDELLRRARELPETRAASLCTLNIVSGSMAAIPIDVPGYVPPNGMRPVTYITDISDGYFRTMGVPLIAGSDFSRGAGDGVAIVNEQFARQFLGGDALGKAFSYGYGAGRQVRITGIVRTAKFRYIREEPQPVIYIPVRHSPFRPGGPAFPRHLHLQVRATGDPNRATERLRGLLHDLAPGLPTAPAISMDLQIEEALARERLLAFLSTLLGGVATALAAIGLYGVLSFAVTRRMREIGIRLSVGAQRPRILTMFLKESAWIVVAGLVVGAPLMLLCGRLASSLLYGLQGQDAPTLIAAIGVLSLVSLAASAIPAARAAHVDPMQALRHE